MLEQSRGMGCALLMHKHCCLCYNCSVLCALYPMNVQCKGWYACLGWLQLCSSRFEAEGADHGWPIVCDIQKPSLGFVCNQVGIVCKHWRQSVDAEVPVWAVMCESTKQLLCWASATCTSKVKVSPPCCCYCCCSCSPSGAGTWCR